jgi:L-threonylcarbamoyladenylate synthase
MSEPSVPRRLPRWRPGDPPDRVAEALARGAVLAIPTESSYGLAVDPRSAAGVAALYRLKGREAGKPLPVVVASAVQVKELGVAADAPQLARVAPCWPAPLTVVLPLAPEAPDLPAAAGGRTVAVRVPDHGLLRRLLARLGPLTATSANPSGEAPVTDPRNLDALLAGADAMVLDGGVLPGGPPSTLIAFEPGGEIRLLRSGRFPADRLEKCLAPPAAG